MPNDLTIVIPTLGRDQVLVETIRSLLALKSPAAEILVIDQSRSHDEATDTRLGDWDSDGAIRWIRLDKPSITRSMNHDLRQAATRLVLFLDDDIRPRGELVRHHIDAHDRSPSL